MSAAETIRLARTVDHVNLATNYLKGNWNNANGFLCDSSIGGQYVLLYGVPGDCTGWAGTTTSSIYRQKARSYIKNLLTEAQP